MRIRVIRKPSVASIDGIQLDRFEPGQTYDVGNSLGALFLAEGWAEPLGFEEPVSHASDDDPFGLTPPHDPDHPPNLIREQYPTRFDDISLAADFVRRRRSREWPPKR
jgi:hypothetical protein